METVGTRLKALRQRTRHTHRTVAERLGFENHSRYSYYESARFKGPLPIDLARQLAELFYRSGKVEPHEVLELAGLAPDEALSQERVLLAERRTYTPNQLHTTVLLPSDHTLTEMFAAMLIISGREDLIDSLAPHLADWLPIALNEAPVGREDELKRGDRHSLVKNLWEARFQ